MKKRDNFFMIERPHPVTGEMVNILELIHVVDDEGVTISNTACSEEMREWKRLANQRKRDIWNSNGQRCRKRHCQAFISFTSFKLHDGMCTYHWLLVG